MSANKPKKNGSQHIQYRKCAKCGDQNMVPATGFTDRDIGPMSTTGLSYECPNCDEKAKIRDAGSLLSGILFSMVSAVIGWWAFQNGPLWYATHLSYFTRDYYEASFIILDLLAFLFYTVVTLFALWFIWSEFVIPVKTLVTHPVTGENRAQNNEEIGQAGKSRRMLVVSFFLFPFLVYVPLFGGIWLLDAMGIDIRSNEIFKFLGIALLFGVTMLLAKRFNVSFALVFFGMVFWMALFVGAVFTLG